MQEVTKGTHQAAHQAAGLTQLNLGVSDWLPYAHFSEGV